MDATTLRLPNRPEQGYVCAECGTATAPEYWVTILDPTTPETTRTEVCDDCHTALNP